MLKFIEVHVFDQACTVNLQHVVDIRKEGESAVITLIDERVARTDESYEQVRDLLANVQGLGI